MRYAPSERLFRLARLLAGTRVGLTLDEMARELGVARRTAERLRDSLEAMFPELRSQDDEQRVRRWLLPGSALVGIVEPRAEVVAAIETAAREFGLRGETDRAALLREASTTLRAVMRPDALRRAEPDIAALMEAEGIAMRPGPRPLVAQGVLATLRRAILGMQLVALRYVGREADEPVARILCPYGLLYGGRGWFVAHVEGLPEMRLWRLDRIASVDLVDRGFQRREDFSLAAYAARWLFHPSQCMTREADGSLIVRFRAGGMLEMCWHLFTWGTAVTIVAPQQLRAQLAGAAATAASHHR